MSKKRTQYSGEFKAKVALAAIRGDEFPNWQPVMGYIPRRSIAGNGSSLNKRLSCFPRTAVLAKKADKPPTIYIVSSDN